MQETIRVLAVDDEPLARARLRGLLQGLEWVALVGEAADGAEALRQIELLAPDVVLLDLEMPDMNGLEVIAASARGPEVVFTTAHDRYAVDAFEVEAVDYLLKPFDAARLGKALERARARLREAPGGLEARHRPGAEPRGYLTRLLIRERGRFSMLPIRQVDWVEARDDYVRVHTAEARHLMHITLTELEQRLDPAAFMRIHRSHLVNLDAVVAIHRKPDGRLTAQLRDGTRLGISRTRAGALRAIGL